MQEYKDLWESILASLREKHMSSITVELWFKEAELVSLTDEVAVISHTSTFKKSMIETRHINTLNQVFEEVLGFPVKIVVTLAGQAAEVETKKPEPVKPEPIETPGITSFNSEYTFDNFVVGGSNKFAHAACTAVATNPAAEYNPLFIYGSSGLGKTHLLNAIMNEMRRRDPNISIIYVKGDEFTNQMIESIATDSREKFRAKYRKADVLLIDDIQFIAGKNSTQEEFFHTFNALYEDRKQIIMTSDRPPRDIKTLEDRLKTRFEWGLTVDIQPPDFELRIAIMKNKAKMMKMSLSDDVLNLIAENLKSNIRQLEGAIKRICARAYLNGEQVTMELAKECISALIVSNDPPEVTAKKIVETVSKKYGIPTEEIYGRKRTKPISNARNVSIYIIRKITSLSLTSIAQIFDRDHTTVMSAVKSVNEEIKTNPLIEIEINEMIKEITE